MQRTFPDEIDWTVWPNVRQNRPPISYKITKEQVDFAVEYLRNQTVSTKELHAAIKEVFPDFDVTPRHLAAVVRDMNLTRKRTRHGHFPKTRFRKEVNRNDELKKFFAVTINHDLNKIVCIDETSLTPFMYRAYSRCNLGSKFIQSTDDNKVFTKHTL